MKTLLLGVALSGLWMANANSRPKSYTVNIPEKCVIGAVELNAGMYRMSIDGSMAVFVSDQTRQTVKTPVTVSTEAKKFEQTEILSSQRSGNPDRITAIELEGTKLKLQFK